jgi:CHASE3 domain sensor protein
MDSSSEEHWWLSLTVAVVLLVVWSAMSLALAYERRLAQASEFFTEAFRFVGRLDVIAGALDHLDVDQKAFLSTGEESFQDGVVQSIQTLDLSIDTLNSAAAQSTSHRALLVALSRSIEQVIASVAESDRIRETGNKAAAAAFFESKEADISQAISQTAQSRVEILSISNRIRSAQDETLLAGLLDDARRWRHVTFSNSAHQPEGAGTAAMVGRTPDKKRAQGQGWRWPTLGHYQRGLNLRNLPFRVKGIS